MRHEQSTTVRALAAVEKTRLALIAEREGNVEFNHWHRQIESMLVDEGETTRRKLAEIALYFESIGIEWQARASDARSGGFALKAAELSLRFLKASAQAAAAVESLKRQRLPSSQPAYQPRHAEWLGR